MEVVERFLHDRRRPLVAAKGESYEPQKEDRRRAARDDRNRDHRRRLRGDTRGKLSERRARRRRDRRRPSSEEQETSKSPRRLRSQSPRRLRRPRVHHRSGERPSHRRELPRHQRVLPLRPDRAVVVGVRRRLHQGRRHLRGQPHRRELERAGRQVREELPRHHAVLPLRPDRAVGVGVRRGLHPRAGRVRREPDRSRSVAASAHRRRPVVGFSGLSPASARPAAAGTRSRTVPSRPGTHVRTRKGRA